jgi:hypothetical protein
MSRYTLGSGTPLGACIVEVGAHLRVRGEYRYPDDGTWRQSAGISRTRNCRIEDLKTKEPGFRPGS